MNVHGKWENRMESISTILRVCVCSWGAHTLFLFTYFLSLSVAHVGVVSFRYIALKTDRSRWNIKFPSLRAKKSQNKKPHTCEALGKIEPRARKEFVSVKRIVTTHRWKMLIGFTHEIKCLCMYGVDDFSFFVVVGVVVVVFLTTVMAPVYKWQNDKSPPRSEKKGTRTKMSANENHQNVMESHACKSKWRFIWSCVWIAGCI